MSANILVPTVMLSTYPFSSPRQDCIPGSEDNEVYEHVKRHFAQKLGACCWTPGKIVPCFGWLLHPCRYSARKCPYVIGSGFDLLIEFVLIFIPKGRVPH